MAKRKDESWEDYLRKVCAESKRLNLEPCPFCKKREFLRAGHESAMAFAVECMMCRCTGPIWSYHRVTGDNEYLLPEVQAEVDKRRSGKVNLNEDLGAYLGRGPENHLDAYLLERAIEDWNTRGPK